MLIDEAIAREREIAEMHRNDIVPKEDYQNMPWIDKENELNMRSAEEHEHLAEWLEELKNYRDKNKMVVRIDCVNSDEFKDILVKTAKEQYNKAIDDAKSVVLQTLDNEILVDTLHLRLEQLKEQNQ